jgi:hypothetical protein
VIVNRIVVTTSVIRPVAFAASVALLALAMPASGVAQEIPDLNGVWAWGRCVGGGGFNCMLLEQDDARLTARARAFQAAYDEIAAPKYDCAPMTIPHMYTDPYEYQIEQMSDRVVITYEKDDVVRTVWLEGYGHQRPRQNQFFVQGYSTGRYENGVLVVETTRFTFDPTGLNSDFKLPSSTQKRVTERYSREDEALRLEVTTEDTFFLREPWAFIVRSQLVDGELRLPWNCDLDAARQTLQLFPTTYPDDPAVERIEQ